MMTTLDHTTDAPVRKTVTVKASAEHAFRVFTEGFDSWWPRTHHIGSSPMARAIVEGFAGGRCYSEQADGSECDWGQVLAWDPPHRLVLAWRITNDWKYQPDLAKSSEVEIRFTPNGDGTTRVDLEHRYFTRHGAGWEAHRAMVDSTGGWHDLLGMFARRSPRTPRRAWHERARAWGAIVTSMAAVICTTLAVVALQKESAVGSTPPG